VLAFLLLLELGRQPMRAFGFIPLTAVLVAATASAATPVLRVDDTELTDIDFKLARQVVALQMRRQNPGAEPSQESVMKRAVEQLVRQSLLLEAAHEAMIVAAPAEVAADIDQQRALRGAAAFDAYLASLGLDAQEYRRRVGDQMAVRKFVDTVVARRITVTEADARTFYEANPATFEHPEEVRLRTILLNLEPNTDEKQAAAAKDRAERIRKRLIDGEDMAAVAKEVSDDPSKGQGGDIGWVRKGKLLPELEPAVWALKPGELSAVLKSPLGYHIVKVEEHRGPGRAPFDEVKSLLTDNLRKEKLVAAIETLVKERRANAKIEALDPAVKAALEGLQPRIEARPPTSGGPATGTPPSGPKRP
jgi:parvulin-like peptidyl-prolyl isomerase